LHQPSPERSSNPVAADASAASVSSNGSNDYAVSHTEHNVPSNSALHVSSPAHYLNSVVTAASVERGSSHGRSDSSVGRSESWWCWKANETCDNMRAYVRLNGLTHIFVGASAKTAGTSVKYFFFGNLELHERDKLAFSAQRHQCEWAVTGSHLFDGLGRLLKSPCARKTLFLLPIREEMSWLRSALKQVCWVEAGNNRCEEEACPDACGNFTWLEMALRNHTVELGQGPHIWIKEWMVRSRAFHTFMFDYDAIDNVLACLPQSGLKVENSWGLKVENSSQLARHIYKRAQATPKVHAGLFRPSINMSDEDIRVAYYAVESTPYWPQPYVKALEKSGCEVASLRGLRVSEGR